LTEEAQAASRFCVLETYCYIERYRYGNFYLYSSS